MSKTIIFFGNERLATGTVTANPILRGLVAAGYDVAAVVTPYKTVTSRSDRPLEVVAAAQELGLRLINPHNESDLLASLRQTGAKLGILAAYGQIVKPEIIDLFPLGIINVHPSLLPKYRGSTPIESALLNGDKTTGVSVMGLASELDAGPVYSQVSLELDGHETKQYLADKLSELGAKLLLETLPEIFSRQLEPKTQDEKLASYTKRITSSKSQIQWSIPAWLIERQIRTYASWPKSKTSLGGLEVIIHQAHVSDSDGRAKAGSLITGSDGLAVQTAQGLLVIDKLQLPGKPVISSQAFLTGYKDKLVVGS